jgi:hypothetical protein
MNPILTALMGALKADKGRDVNRTLVLAGVLWCAIQIQDVKERVTIIETKLSVTRQAVTAPGSVTNSTAQVGPEWPKHVADAFAGQN